MMRLRIPTRVRIIVPPIRGPEWAAARPDPLARPCRRDLMFRRFLAAVCLSGALGLQPARAALLSDQSAPPAPSLPTLSGRVVAQGIPGVTAVSPVGVFHPGGPI